MKNKNDAIKIIEIKSRDNIKLILDRNWHLIQVKSDNFVIDNPIYRRMLLLNHYKIDSILDVGANTGQYAKNIRAFGYTGRIVSFEPLSSVFTVLKKNAQRDPLWKVVNIALGEANDNRTINIAGNSRSSSLLPMLPIHLKYSPHTKYIGKERAKMRTLDSIIGKYIRPNEKIFLKVDTQGYEKRVVDGAINSLNKIIGMQLELSLVSLYEGESLLKDMLDFISEKGYNLVSLEPGFTIKTGQLFQVEAIFFRDTIS